MFISLSYTTHTIISISLHILGVLIGLFVWYLFPKHPTRSIIQLPSEKIAISIDSPVIAKNLNAFYSKENQFTNFQKNTENQKLIDFDDLPPIPAIRQFG